MRQPAFLRSYHMKYFPWIFVAPWLFPRCVAAKQPGSEYGFPAVVLIDRLFSLAKCYSDPNLLRPQFPISLRSLK